MITPNDQALLDRIAREIAAAAPPKIALILDPQEALVLLGNLQLALRHPGNMGTPAAIALAIARRLQDYLSFSPALADLAARGWQGGDGETIRN